MSDDPVSEEPRRLAWVLALGIAGIAAWLRLWHLRQGLPGMLHPDEGPVLDAVKRVMASPSLHPRFFIYPALQIYLTAGAATLAYPFMKWAGAAQSWSLFCMDEDALATIGRALVAAFGLGTVGLAYAVGKEMRSRRAGVFAAVFMAVCPYHAMSTRYTSVDVPMTFWVMAGLWCAVAHVRRPRAWRLWLGAAFVGAAAATKYLGVLFFLPLAASALMPPRPSASEGWGRRGLLIAGLFAVTFAVFSLLAPYTWLDYASFKATMDRETQFGYQEQFGWDLTPSGLIYHRYVYQLLASLPFTLGFGVYAMALVGLVVVWRQCRGTRAPLLLAVAGYFVLVGSLEHIFPRYLIPLLPLLCVAAGIGMAGLTRSASRAVRCAGWAIGGAGTLHAALMAGTMAAGMAPQPGHAAAAWLDEHLPPGSTIAVAHERPIVPKGKRRYRWVRLEPDKPWLARVQPDCLVVDGWTLRSLERAGASHADRLAFFASLDAPGSAYRLAAEFDPHYFTESLYAKLDPQLANQFESACIKLYVRK